MKRKTTEFALLPIALITVVLISGCKSEKVNADAGAPPQAKTQRAFR